MVIRVQNEHTYSAADGGQKICRVFSETAAFESDGVKHERKSQYANKHVHIASGYCWYILSTVHAPIGT